MNRVLKIALLGIAIGLSVFVIIGIALDIAYGGTFTLVNWRFTKMAIGAMVVGVGFSVPSIIYENEKLPYGIKVLIHMGIGCTVMLVTALLVGWIPLEAGLKICAFAVVSEILAAFLIWLCFAVYYKKMANQMNQRIKEKDSK